MAISKLADMCLLLRSGFHLVASIGGVLQKMVVLLEGSPISTEELELCPSDHWVLGHLPDQGPSLPIAQFGRAASSRKSLVGSKLLPFKNAGGHEVLGDLQCCRNCLVPFPRSVPRHNPVSELYGKFL